VRIDRGGPLEAVVSGAFKVKGQTETEVKYAVKISAGDAVDEPEGILKRSVMSVRTSRRGGRSTFVKEGTEKTYRLQSVRGPGNVTITAESIDDEKDLEDGLIVTLRSGGLPPIVFILLGVLAVLVAIGLDARLVDAKSRVKTYLAAGAGVTLVFALHFPDEATPLSIVRPAVSAAVLALLIGGLGGWVLGTVARLLFGGAPKAKKARR
jgi:hypothetical protein